MAILDNKTEDKKRAAKKTGTKDLYAKEGAGAAKAVSADKKFGSAYRVLVKPLVTEKASVASAENKYIFEIFQDANKVEVAKAIKEVYGIMPEKVNIIRTLGKKARYGKTSGKRKDRKKAIVTMPEGQTIKVYEGV